MATGADCGDGRHSILIRRNNTTGELAFYRCWTPEAVSIATLVRIAGIRWTVEESFQAAKGQVGLDQHQVRRWNSWHRFTTLAMAALAVLAICVAEKPRLGRSQRPTDHDRADRQRDPSPCQRVLIEPVLDLIHRLHWSGWRRQHQLRAKRSHYTRRLNLEIQP